MAGMAEKEATKRGVTFSAPNILEKPFGLVELIAKVKESLSKS